MYSPVLIEVCSYWRDWLPAGQGTHADHAGDVYAEVEEIHLAIRELLNVAGGVTPWDPVFRPGSRIRSGAGIRSGTPYPLRDPYPFRDPYPSSVTVSAVEHGRTSET